VIAIVGRMAGDHDEGGYVAGRRSGAVRTSNRLGGAAGVLDLMVRGDRAHRAATVQCGPGRRRGTSVRFEAQVTGEGAR